MVPLRSKPCRGALAERDRERVGVAATAGPQGPAASDAGVDAAAILRQASVGSKTRSAGRNLLIFSTAPNARG
jgi:hypothetical protein